MFFCIRLMNLTCNTIHYKNRFFFYMKQIISARDAGDEKTTSKSESVIDTE